MEDGKVMIDVVYEDNHLLIVVKPIGIPVQAEKSGDIDFLSMLKSYIKKKYNKPGNVYLGLVHRLDRPVSGIMVFAKTSKCAKRLSSQIANHEFKKNYYAVVCGDIDSSGVYKDKILKNAKLNKSFISEDGKDAELSFVKKGFKNGLSLADINLKTGRSHQIRVQFSYHGFPLYGDQKYNDNTPLDDIALFAYKVSFYHPVTHDLLTFSLPMPSKYPFNLFEN